MLFSEGNRLVYKYDAEQVWIEPWGPNALRVRATKTREMPNEDWALLEPEKTTPNIKVSESSATLTNGNIKATLTPRGKLTLHNTSTGLLLLEEYARHRRDVTDPKCSALEIEAREFKPLAGSSEFHLTARFESLDPKEKIYGMGQYQQPYLDLKGTQLELAHRNSQASVPFAVSSRGYGFLWNNAAIGTAVFGKNVMSFEARATKVLDYWVVAGDAPAQIVEAYACATGKVPRGWGWGLMLLWWIFFTGLSRGIGGSMRRIGLIQVSRQPFTHITRFC
jgi:alpha-D-xyloside xylohydrolase